MGSLSRYSGLDSGSVRKCHQVKAMMASSLLLSCTHTWRQWWTMFEILHYPFQTLLNIAHMSAWSTSSLNTMGWFGTW